MVVSCFVFVACETKDKEKLTIEGKLIAMADQEPGRENRRDRRLIRGRSRDLFSQDRERRKDKYENTLLELKYVYGKLEFASDALFFLSESASKGIC